MQIADCGLKPQDAAASNGEIGRLSAPSATSNHEPAAGRHEELIVVELTAARLGIAFVVAASIAYGARRASALSRSGTVAAVGVGTAAVLAGWPWAALLMLYFVPSAALTRFKAPIKAARVGALVAKGGERDAVQVLANGGVFALAAVLWLASQWEGWRALGAAALAAAASDTWATEIGTLARRSPRSIVNWRPVPTGTSGGVSLPGVVAGVAGAAFVAMTAGALGWRPGVALAALVGGIAGSTIDSLLGATIQARRRCDRCSAATERPAHDCGASTRLVGGVSWMDNDVVNALSTAAGGLLGLLLSA